MNIDGTEVETAHGTLQKDGHIHQSGGVKYSIEKRTSMARVIPYRYSITRANSVHEDKGSTQQTMRIYPTSNCPRSKSDTKNRSADGTVKVQRHHSKVRELEN